MNIGNALGIISKNNVITSGDISFGYVDGRIMRVVLWEEEEGFDCFPTEITLAEFENFCETFNPSLPNAILPLPPQKLKLSEDGEYVFDKMPSMDCPKCFRFVSYKTAKISGRYAFCPGCGKQFYKAPRLDGQRDEVEVTDKPSNQWGQSKKKEKPVEISIEDALAKTEGKVRKSRLIFATA